jgi:hypothetical protein
MSVYAHIKRCLELSDRDIASAIVDRRLTKALLDQLAKVSRPADGAPKLLIVFAKMAAQAVEWVDGALRVEMVGDGNVTVVELLCELGLGMHERVVPAFKMNVPLEEFTRAVERVPRMIEPLALASSSERRLVLTATSTAGEEQPLNEPRPSVPIADDSLYKRHPSKNKMNAVRPSAPPPSTRGSRGPRSEGPASQRAPTVVPKPPPLPGGSKTRETDQPPRSVVARVALTKIAAPRAAVEKGPARGSAAPKRASKPPAKRMSARPPPTRASKPPARASSPPKSKRPAATDAPDAAKIDGGWDEDS